VPRLPAATWGPFVHIGQEYRYQAGEWQHAQAASTQLPNMRQIPRSLLALFASESRRASAPLTMAAHGPHQYLAALRPSGLATEFGDADS
jgi:hypothetical protein